jgi:hypothetical protein
MRTSFDAFLNLNLTADPDVACRFAEGMPVIHPYTRSWVQLQTPLDFLVVSDHAEFLGGIRDIYYNGIQQPDAGPIDRIVNWYRTRTIRNAINDDTAVQLFVSVLPQSQDPVAAAAGWQVHARYANSIGAAQLETVWTDPGFDPALRAFYYVRVLQIPTPRHSLYDALALSMDAPTEGPSVIQERAFTSPIWYTP